MGLCLWWPGGGVYATTDGLDGRLSSAYTPIVTEYTPNGGKFVTFHLVTVPHTEAAT
jgi:hypothetical protein